MAKLIKPDSKTEMISRKEGWTVFMRTGSPFESVHWLQIYLSYLSVATFSRLSELYFWVYMHAFARGIDSVLTSFFKFWKPYFRTLVKVFSPSISIWFAFHIGCMTVTVLPRPTFFMFTRCMLHSIYTRVPFQATALHGRTSIIILLWGGPMEIKNQWAPWKISESHARKKAWNHER